MALRWIGLLALSALAPLAPHEKGEGWDEVWARLEGLAPPLPEPRLARLARLRGELALRRASAPDDPRTALLAAQIERLAGGSPALVLPPEEPWPFGARASWLAAQVAPPGPPRVRAVLAALERDREGPGRDQVRLAWETAVAEAEALRLEQGAVPIQRALHERFHAPWTAINLALSNSRLGRWQEADRLLAEAISLEERANRPTGDLWSQRGLVHLGVGHDSLARDYLLRGRARGSSDAAQILAKLSLDAGDLEAARRGFRALLREEPAVAWARRGWGLTLLPGAGRDTPTTTPAR